MKHYALALININTNIIDHIALSQKPLEDNRVGYPTGHETTHKLVRFEFDADPDQGSNIMKARTALSELEWTGNNICCKGLRCNNVLVGTKQFKK